MTGNDRYIQECIEYSLQSPSTALVTSIAKQEWKGTLKIYLSILLLLVSHFIKIINTQIISANMPVQIISLSEIHSIKENQSR